MKKTWFWSIAILLGVAAHAAAADKFVYTELGDPSLTSGLPGKGELQVAEIRKWLDDEKNHETLVVKLPLGLSLAQSNLAIPEDNPLTRAKIELGRQLYFDPRLSLDSTISCASCHSPEHGYARETQFGVGIKGQTGDRNSPISYNRIVSKAQFWDGRAPSLEAQAVGPIANPIEMGYTHDACVERLTKIEGYRLQFEKVFGKSGVTIDNVGKAIASFERTIVSGTSPADYYEPLRTFTEQFKDDLKDLKAFEEDDPESYKKYVALKKASDAHPMSESAKRGRTLFFSETAKCTACHAGGNFSDEQYHNLGVGMDKPKPDLGRFNVTKQDKDRGAFKTPTIRNVALSAPYMHDGSQKTLEEVVEWYAKGGHANPYLSDKMKPLKLSKQDKADLVEYMKSLTGPFPKVATDRLPQD